MACAALIGGFLMVTGLARAQDKTFIVLDDEASIDDLIPFLTNGAATVEVDTDDPYPDDADHDAALRVDSPAGDNQKFNPNIPGWSFQIVDGATAADEFQYITFAWRKEGAAGIQLQLSAQPGGWSHRYHAAANLKGWNPSIEVTVDDPDEWQVHTRDMFEDWGEMVLTGMAFTPGSGDYGLFDHIVLHQAPEDPLLPQAVDARGKSAAVWGDIKRDIR
jgi:hypothetical protein